MGFLDRFKGRRGRRVLVIGLDGTPYSLIKELIECGEMPNLALVVANGSFKRMKSIYPTVSSVAWSSFMTGKNPAKHGIFGFIDLQPHSYKTFIPTSRTMRSETLWEILSKAGKRVVVINVPVTYPPREVNGILISGFLSPDIEKAVYPPAAVETLKRLDYIIDADPWAARESKDRALKEVNAALDSRVRALFHFLDDEEWDFFQCHIMATDRLHHFLWEQMEKGDEKYATYFFDFYRKIDEMLGQVRERLDENTTLIVMSDHGFCTLKREVYIDYWLAEKGWLKFKKHPPENLQDLHPDARAYSLIPGRIFINLKGRGPRGSVAPASDYEALREEIAAEALKLRDPESGERMIAKVLKREEAYSGPYLSNASDLILVPVNGYDLKGGLKKEVLTYKGEALVGMHTYDDAMLCIEGQDIVADDLSILDVMPTILSLMNVPIPKDVDGSVLLES